MFMDLLSEEPNSLMAFGAACSDVTEILAEMSAYRKLAQVREAVTELIHQVVSQSVSQSVRHSDLQSDCLTDLQSFSKSVSQ